MAETSEISSRTLREARSRVPGRAVVSDARSPDLGAGPGTQTRGYGPDQVVVYADALGLSPDQAVVYDRIAQTVAKRIARAADERADEFVLMNDWEWPELMRGLSYRSANIVGNVRPGLLPVWNAIEGLLQKHGFQVKKAAQPWRLIATR